MNSLRYEAFCTCTLSWQERVSRGLMREKGREAEGDLSLSSEHLKWSANPPRETRESLVDQTHRVEEKSRIAGRRCSNGPSISLPRSRIYQAHGVSTIAVVWISCSAWVLCISQLWVTRYGPAPGLWNCSAPTHRFFVITKRSLFCLRNSTTQPQRGIQTKLSW